MVGSQVVQSSIETADMKNGNITNSNDKMPEGYWGLDRYGLDYRAKSLTDEAGKVGAEQILKDRIAEWDQSTGDPQGTDPTKRHGRTMNNTRLTYSEDGEFYTSTETISQEEIDNDTAEAIKEYSESNAQFAKELLEDIQSTETPGD